MRFSIFLILFFFTNSLLSQTLSGVVLDSETKNPVSYANIVFKDRNIGASADVNGIFKIELSGNDEELIISCVGYEDLILNAKSFDLKDNKILLSPKTTELDELMLSNDQKIYSSKKRLGLPLKAKVTTNLPFGNEVCALISNKTNADGLLKTVYVDLKKLKEADYIASYNIKFYEYDVVNRCPGDELYNKNLIVYPENKTYQLKVDVDTLGIRFPKNGICIGIEVLNTGPDKKIKQMAKVGPSIIFTHTSMEILTWSRFRNKKWHVDTHKSPIRKDFINLRIGADVVTETK